MNKLDTGLHYPLKLDSLPSNWQVGYVGDFAYEIQPGFASGKHNNEGVGITHIRPFNIDRLGKLDLTEIKSVAPDSDIKRLRSNDVLFNNTNSPELVGKTTVITTASELGFSNHMTRIRFRDDVVPRFAAYQLHFLWMAGYYLHNCVKHVNQASISSKMLATSVPFVFPLPDHQKQIVAEIEKQFSRLDEAIANLKRTKANLKCYKAAVLKIAFEGRLIETEAEIASREGRSYETGEQLLRRILKIRCDQWKGKGTHKESIAPAMGSLPDLAEGWVWASIDQLTSDSLIGLDRGRGQQNSEGVGVPYVKMNNVTMEGDVTNSHLVHVNASDEEKQRFGLTTGDLLFNTRNSKELVGKVGLVRTTPKDAIYNNNLMRLRLVEGIDPGFVCAQMCSDGFRRRMERVKKATTNVAAVYAKDLFPLQLAIPATQEQLRITAEIDRRFSFIGEVETQIEESLKRAKRLRESVLSQAFSGQLLQQKISLVSSTHKASTSHRPNKHFARALLSAEIVHRLHAEPTFGRIKHQKIFHLCEHIAVLEEIQGQYHREAAGPLDSRLIYTNEKELGKQKWFKTVAREQFGHAYVPMEKAGSHSKYVQKYWPEKLSTIDGLIELMRKWDTDQSEIFSTVYAAWNDLIIWEEAVTDDAIIHEVLHRWHDAKRRFPEERWRAAILWMRQKGHIPTGFGKPTCQPKKTRPG